MVSEIQDTAATLAAELWIPEFGLLDTAYIDENKKYQGRIYRLGQDKTKAVSELFGYTASFENANIRTAFIDIIKTEGHVSFEIERNTKPTDLNLRYARDRWDSVEPSAKEKDALRPWIINRFYCKFLPERSFTGLADHLRMKQEHLEHFYIRINFKDRTAALIAEDGFTEEFPTGAFQVFALPDGHVAVIPATELSDQSQAPVREVRAPVDPGPRYATYSQSEVDRMFKLQSENITNTIAGKVAGQQRSFLEAVEAQEKTFNKLADKFLTQFEDVRTRIDNQTKTAQENAHIELEQFKSQLTKELDQFRAHVNKNIIPIPKSIEETIKSLQAVPKTKGVQQQESLKPLLYGITGALLIVVLINVCITCLTLGSISEIKTQLNPVSEKATKTP